MPHLLKLCIGLAAFLIGQHVHACAESFSTVLERHVNAIKQRDLQTYMSTISPTESQLVILPDGSTWNSRNEVEEGHKQWFADKTWEFNIAEVQRKERADWGLVVYRASVDRPQQAGKPFLLSMMFASAPDGCWYLEHDQNTLLSSP